MSSLNELTTTDNPSLQIRGWILYSDSTNESHEIQRLREEAPKLGIHLSVFSSKDFDIKVSDRKNPQTTIFVKGIEEPLPDFFWPRLGASTSYFALSIIREMERLGVLVINNSEAIEKVKDKLYCHQLLSKYKLPIPQSILLKFPVEDPDLIEREIGFPAVIKMLVGSQGKEVFLAETKEEFLKIINVIEVTKSSANIIVQEFIKKSFGQDLRVFIAGGRILACMKRESVNGDFRANISQGGKGTIVEVDDQIAWIALEAAKALGLDIAGVDLLFGEDSYLICEINSNPGFKGLEEATKKNIAQMLLTYIKFKIA